MAPRNRILPAGTLSSVLEDLRRAREACVRLHAAAPIHGEHYRAASEVMRAIDGFAEVATGDASHFHQRMCPVDQGPPREP